ncbi:MAG: ChaN family lipoprotein [Candidatus Obscuribacterales bacterium]|nr:ChaN family lipoprotein [Candidatus Obscuribacterales bacterium]
MSTIILILLALGVVALIATRKPRSSDSQMTDVCPADGSPPAPEVTVIDSDGKEITFDQFADRLLQSDIISVGELHDSAAHHEMQLRIIEAVFKRDPDLGVGMEMFQRPFQDVLDSFIAGEITEEQLVEDSEYKTRWGFPWELYQPIVDHARLNKIPVAALNAPKELTRRVKEVGWDGLVQEEKDALGPVDFQVPAHRDHWLPMLSHMHGNRTPSADEKERSYQIMTIWDDYMAQSAANFKSERGLRRMIILAGGGHVEGGFGIPDRAAGYSKGKSVTVGIVITGINDHGPNLPVDFLIRVSPGKTGICSGSGADTCN